MYLRIENFLTETEVAAISGLAREAVFQDGRSSNPHNMAKLSLITDQSDPAVQKAAQIVLAALPRCEEARRFALPRRIAVPTLCRYDAGMRYGAHVDSAYLPVGPQPLRSDLSCTIFIADPAAYQGGELVIYSGTEELRFKGVAGSAIFYPSTTIHEVSPVTAGSRLVMITFIESEIPDQLPRDLLYRLNEVRALEGMKMDWQSRIELQYVSENLRRMWSR